MSYSIQNKSQNPAGIFVVDSERRIVSLNRKFIEMWELPKHLIDLRSDTLTLNFVSKQCKDPHKFIAKVTKLYNYPKIEMNETIDLKDGRILECYSAPQWLEKENVGRIWTFQEISDRTNLPIYTSW
ncbi:PAS-domain containing protein [Aetokthonos hydrillicola Thurmond2011]|jgi:PAS domain-containing protein|uniref:PAS-domain containing protein n=1 Tax=Aetokthonos hydrillicola Thurmond2011 TaxID=2712845 RepID=A0AAP5IGN4_9CYAN|nr:PAS-domain containing protein [Aetokthonos hydrillicola]MBW4583914.1 PAS-domain containing protein [Aetokthonos hydrillicola CCALA 1050]MDR9898890.1 PAS-domain containing protein [Aetokthonos hydrillicola Thurmond2011]